MLARRDWLPTAVRAVGVKRKLKAGQTSFRLRGCTVGLYEVLSGNVRLVRSDRAGHEVALYIAAIGSNTWVRIRQWSSRAATVLPHF